MDTKNSKTATRLTYKHIVKSITWMAVWPLGKPPHQPILGGQDEAPVLVKVGVLEHV